MTFCSFTILALLKTEEIHSRAVCGLHGVVDAKGKLFKVCFEGVAQKPFGYPIIKTVKANDSSVSTMCLSVLTKFLTKPLCEAGPNPVSTPLADHFNITRVIGE